MLSPPLCHVLNCRRVRTGSGIAQWEGERALALGWRLQIRSKRLRWPVAACSCLRPCHLHLSSLIQAGRLLALFHSLLEQLPRYSIQYTNKVGGGVRFPRYSFPPHCHCQGALFSGCTFKRHILCLHYPYNHEAARLFDKGMDCRMSTSFGISQSELEQESLLHSGQRSTNPMQSNPPCTKSVVDTVLPYLVACVSRRRHRPRIASGISVTGIRHSA